MKVLVPIKRVIDFAVKIRPAASGLGVEKNNVKQVMNPFCEIAVEEAVRLKEKGLAKEIVAISIGGKPVQETLRTALAMGACRAVHVDCDKQTDLELQPLAVAKILSAVAKKESPQVVLLGKQAIDGDNNQTPQMLAGLLGWGQATFASKIEVAEDKQSLDVVREVDGGLRSLRVPTPCVVSADLRLNEPRYATLPNIMKARKKPIESLSIDELGISTEGDLLPRLEILSVDSPPQRQGGVKVETVDELLNKLQQEGRL